jgi:hypothetical protein
METEKVCKPGDDCAPRLQRQYDEISSVTPLSAAHIKLAGGGGPQIGSSCRFQIFGRCGISRCQGRGSKYPRCSSFN